MIREKRRFTRVPFSVEAEVSIGNTAYRSEEVTNLSVGGCLLPVHVPDPVGTKCHVTIWLGGTSSELTVSMEGEIVRITPEAVAIKFVSVDVDSLLHLQNIVRYNSSDPDAVEREIRDNFGIV